MKSIITYFTGGANYAIPGVLAFDYCIRQLRFIFASFVITYYFNVDYSIITMALAMLLADLRFYMDFDEYMNQVNNPEEEFSDKDDEQE